MTEEKENVIFIPESKTFIVDGRIINEKDLSKEEQEALLKTKET